MSENLYNDKDIKDIAELLKQTNEELKSMKSEIADLRKLVKTSKTSDETTTDKEEPEDHDFSFSVAKEGDIFYSVWITDDKESYKNPFIVCDDTIDSSYMSNADIYDITHNISVFTNHLDAIRYANHVNIDLTVYRLKSYYNSVIAPKDSQKTEDENIILNYRYENNKVCIHCTNDDLCLSVMRGRTVLSSKVSFNMLKWMIPILEKYFGYKVVY